MSSRSRGARGVARRRALIVATHLPGHGHALSGRSCGPEVRPAVCRDAFDYWRALSEAWEHPGPIINVEHDVAVGAEHLDELLACPHPLCSWAYASHWVTTGIGDVIAAGTGARDRRLGPDAYYLQGGEEWARWSAIGLVKVAPEARVGPLRQEPWQTLELAVEDAVRGPWHMHWPPVTHHHW